MLNKKHIPESWDIYEVIRFLEEIILKETGALKVRITSIEETKDFEKNYIEVKYEMRRITSRYQIPKSDRSKVFDYSMVENHMKTYMRDGKIDDILK